MAALAASATAWRGLAIAHLALGALRDLADGAGDLADGGPVSSEPLASWRAAAEHRRGGQPHLADHGGQRGAGGVVGLHRRRGVVADLAHGLGHVADLVARAPVDRGRDGRQLEGQVARGELPEAEAQTGDVVPAQRGQAREDRLRRCRRIRRMVSTHAGTPMRKMSASRASTSRRAPWKVSVACRASASPSATFAS